MMEREVKLNSVQFAHLPDYNENNLALRREKNLG